VPIGGKNQALAIPPPPEAFAVIAELVRVFHGRVHIVSKAGPRVQRLTRAWLQAHGFFELTSVSERALHFCRERHEKRDYAIKLGLTHFVDDRLDLLVHLTDVVPHRYLFGPQPSVPSWAVHVIDWPAVRRALI
jgi:hypothetical protein